MNSVGEGARSNERSATPAAPATAPGAPTLNSATRRQRQRRARLERARLRRRLGDHRLQGLPRHVERRRDAARRRSAPSPAGPTPALTNGTTYYYQVSAVNSVGEGVTLQRALRHPGRARDRARRADAQLRDRRQRQRRARLERAPSDGGSAITGYKVYRGTSSGGETPLRDLGTVTSWTDTDASNGTTYYYQVTAVNSVGEGARSNERSATPAAPATAPGAPTLNSASAGSGSVALAWSAPASDGGSAITGYKVYRGTSSGGETLLATLGTGTSWTDTGVANGTTYYYQVTAVNSRRRGRRSNERSATPAAARDRARRADARLGRPPATAASP